MNNTERKLYKYPIPSMDGYIQAIGYNLTFDGEKFFSDQETLNRFNRGDSINDPNTWLSAVSWKDDSSEHPPQARIETDFGRRFYLLNENTGFAPNIDEGENRDVLLNTLALAEARLRVLRENTPDTYALLQLREDIAINKLVEARSNLLEKDSTKYISLKEVLEGVNGSSSTVSPIYKVTAGITAASLILAACAPMISPNQTDIDNSVNQPKVSEVVDLPTPKIGITPGVVESNSTPPQAENFQEGATYSGSDFNLDGRVDMGNQAEPTPAPGWQELMNQARELQEAEVVDDATILKWEKPVEEEGYGADIKSLVSILKNKLASQNVKDGKSDLDKVIVEVVSTQGQGWGVKVTDKKTGIPWSTNFNGKFTDFPYRVPMDPETNEILPFEIIPYEVELEDGERWVMVIQNGTPFWFIEKDGGKTGVFNTKTNSVESFDKENQEFEVEVVETYTIQEGDSIKGIAEKHGISIKEILLANPQIVRMEYGLKEKQLNIPRNFPEGSIEVLYNNEFNNAPDFSDYTKKADSEMRFVFYENIKTGKIDIVWDTQTSPKTGEIYGYALSEKGIVMLTSDEVMEGHGYHYPAYYDHGGSFDAAVEVWKKYHLDGTNPFGLSQDTPIEVEIRYSNSPSPWGTEKITKYSDQSYYGIWASWTKNGSFRLITYVSPNGKTSANFIFSTLYQTLPDRVPLKDKWMIDNVWEPPNPEYYIGKAYIPSDGVVTVETYPIGVIPQN